MLDAYAAAGLPAPVEGLADQLEPAASGQPS